MGRESSRKAVLAALVAAGIWSLLIEAVHAGSITFLTPREATVRHNGVQVRGGVKSMTPDEVVVVLKGGTEKSFAMSGVTSINAADGSFKYLPAQESFDDFLEKSANVRGVTIVRDDASGEAGDGDPKTIASVSNAYARAIGMQPAASPQFSSSSGGFAQADGFAGASQQPRSLAKLDAPVIPEIDRSAIEAMERERKAAAAAAAAPNPQFPAIFSGGSAAPGGGRVEIIVCSNPACGKEVPGARYGEKCPHCGILWAQQSVGDIVASTPPVNSTTPGTPGGNTTSTDPRDPFNRPAPVNNAAAAPVLPVAGAPVIPGAAAPQGFSLETLPWWGKLLGFGASIMVLMFILGRR